MKYVFHPEALEEYRQAALWFAAREPELGLRFIESVEDAITSCRSTCPLASDRRRCPPLPHPRLSVRNPVHDRNRFLLIVAVMHCSRAPGYWRLRIGEP